MLLNRRIPVKGVGDDGAAMAVPSSGDACPSPGRGPVLSPAAGRTRAFGRVFSFNVSRCPRALPSPGKPC